MAQYDDDPIVKALRAADAAEADGGTAASPYEDDPIVKALRLADAQETQAPQEEGGFLSNLGQTLAKAPGHALGDLGLSVPEDTAEAPTRWVPTGLGRGSVEPVFPTAEESQKWREQNPRGFWGALEDKFPGINERLSNVGAGAEQALETVVGPIQRAASKYITEPASTAAQAGKLTLPWLGAPTPEIRAQQEYAIRNLMAPFGAQQAADFAASPKGEMAESAILEKGGPLGATLYQQALQQGPLTAATLGMAGGASTIGRAALGGAAVGTAGGVLAAPKGERVKSGAIGGVVGGVLGGLGGALTRAQSRHAPAAPEGPMGPRPPQLPGTVEAQFRAEQIQPKRLPGEVMPPKTPDFVDAEFTHVPARQRLLPPKSEPGPEIAPSMAQESFLDRAARLAREWQEEPLKNNEHWEKRTDETFQVLDELHFGSDVLGRRAEGIRETLAELDTSTHEGRVLAEERKSFLADALREKKAMENAYQHLNELRSKTPTPAEHARTQYDILRKADELTLELKRGMDKRRAELLPDSEWEIKAKVGNVQGKYEVQHVRILNSPDKHGMVDYQQLMPGVPEQVPGSMTPGGTVSLRTVAERPGVWSEPKSAGENVFRFAKRKGEYTELAGPEAKVGPEDPTQVLRLPELQRQIEADLPASIKRQFPGHQVDPNVMRGFVEPGPVSERAERIVRAEIPDILRGVETRHKDPFGLVEEVNRRADRQYRPGDVRAVTFQPGAHAPFGKRTDASVLMGLPGSSSTPEAAGVMAHEAKHVEQSSQGYRPELFPKDLASSPRESLATGRPMQPGEAEAYATQEEKQLVYNWYDQVGEALDPRQREALLQEPTLPGVPAPTYANDTVITPAPRPLGTPTPDEITAILKFSAEAGGKPPMPENGLSPQLIATSPTLARLPPDPNIFARLYKGALHPVHRVTPEVSAYLRELNAVHRVASLDMQQIVKDWFKVGGRDIKNPEVRRLVDRALRGDNQAMAQLPSPIQDRVTAITQQIAQNEKMLVQQGQLSEVTVAEHIRQGNLYLRRTYLSRLFPKGPFKYRPLEDVQDRVAVFLENEAIRQDKPIDRGQIVAEMCQLIDGSRDGPEQLQMTWANSKLRKDLFKRKMNIPVEIRDFLGESPDGVFNSALTLSQQNYNINLFKLQGAMALDPAIARTGHVEGLTHPKPLPDDPKAFGALANKYVIPQLREALGEISQGAMNIPGWWSTLVSTYKFFKIPLRASAWLRNFMGNVVYGHLNGFGPFVNPVRWGKYMGKAIEALNDFHTMGNDNQWVREATQDGSFFTELASVEIKRQLSNMNHLLGLTRPDKYPHRFVWEMGKLAGKSQDTVSSFYDTADQVWKLATYMHNRDKALTDYADDPTIKQMGERRWASYMVNDTFPNYSALGRYVDNARRTGLFRPTMSFFAENIRIMSGVVKDAATTRNPDKAARLLGLMLIVEALGNMMKIHSGLTPDELQAAEGDLSNAQKRNAPVRQLWPYKDAEGRIQWFDYTPYFPLGEMLSGDPDAAWYNRALKNIVIQPFSGGPLDFPSRILMQGYGIEKDPEAQPVPKELTGIWTGIKETLGVMEPSVVNEAREFGRMQLTNPPLSLFGGIRPTEERLTPGQSAAKLIGLPRPIPVGDASRQAVRREQAGEIRGAQKGLVGAAMNRSPTRKFGPGQVQFTREEIIAAQRQALQKIREERARRAGGQDKEK